MENNKDQHLEADPRKYFTEDGWKKLSYYEQFRIRNTYKIYVDMTNSGFEMEKPDFMVKTKKSPMIQPEIQEQPFDNLSNTKHTEHRAKRAKSEDNNDSNLENSKSKKRYPKRNVPTKNYKEEEIIPDDYFVYCDICMNEFLHKCNIHEPIYLPDNPVPLIPRNPNRARETVPKGWLNVSSSKIYNGGDGVWALKMIKMGVRFGPYEGITGNEETNGEYSWQIKRDGKVMCYIDGKDTCVANWMRFVNCARNKSEQNLMAYQYKCKIYYRAIEDIAPGTELMVFYGPQFARELGIDTKNFNSPPDKPLKDNVFKCENCYLAFSSPIYLENHTGRCSNKKITTMERKVSRIIRDDRTENTNNNNNDIYKCHLCTNIYTIKSFYDRHLLYKHCIYDENQRHYLTNNQDVMKPTDSNSTSTDSGYNDELTKQSASIKRRYKCSDCHKAFISRSNLENHIRIHTGEKPFKCQTCQKTFTHVQSLKYHNLTHTGEKPHECDVCQKRFTQKCHLITHKRYHDNVKPYQCPECDKLFTQVGDLNKHMLCHTGAKPHHCHICSYKCTLAGDLKRHIRTHTGEKPYTCQYCHISFTNSYSLTYHKQKHHSNGDS